MADVDPQAVEDKKALDEPFEHLVAFADDPNNEPKAKDRPIDSLKPYKPREIIHLTAFTVQAPSSRQ